MILQKGEIPTMIAIGHLVHPLAVCGDGDECQDQAQSGRMQGDEESKWEWENAKSGRMQGD